MTHNIYLEKVKRWKKYLKIRKKLNKGSILCRQQEGASSDLAKMAVAAVSSGEDLMRPGFESTQFQGYFIHLNEPAFKMIYPFFFNEFESNICIIF